jgi:hypothetical protein
LVAVEGTDVDDDALPVGEWRSIIALALPVHVSLTGGADRVAETVLLFVSGFA